MQLVEGAVRAANNPSGAFERASAAVRSRNEGDGPIGVARSAARAADLATGGVLTRVREIAGSVREGFSRANTAAGSQSAPEDEIVGTVVGKIGGINATLRPNDGLPQWGNLSGKLIARLYACDSKGKEIVSPGALRAGFSSNDVRGPITEAQFEATLNWQSPFENAGPESKAPALMAMLQTGQVATLANSLLAEAGGDASGGLAGAARSALIDAASKTAGYARDLEGRTGITKLNSRQVFSGMPPIKITMVLHLRAVTDPQTEVMDPYRRLLEWALPQELAEAGVINELITSGSSDFIKAMFPSSAPRMVGFSYANNRYSPMVIESIGNTIDGPMGPTGLPVYRAVQLTLATLTALDRNDVAGIFSRS